MNITIRNIPDDVIKKIKTLSEMEKRSLNSEILMVLEKGMQEEIKNRFKTKDHISKTSQISIWKKLSNSWQDDRTTEEIKNDIYENRTLGREFDL
ncbi:MAG: FitA-like ribbon-helix-helix domain-containing protein [Fidelibacterota bacterium]